MLLLSICGMGPENRRQAKSDPEGNGLVADEAMHGVYTGAVV